MPAQVAALFGKGLLNIGPGQALVEVLVARDLVLVQSVKALASHAIDLPRLSALLGRVIAVPGHAEEVISSFSGLARSGATSPLLAVRHDRFQHALGRQQPACPEMGFGATRHG